MSVPSGENAGQRYPLKPDPGGEFDILVLFFVPDHKGRLQRAGGSVENRMAAIPPECWLQFLLIDVFVQRRDASIFQIEAFDDRQRRLLKIDETDFVLVDEARVELHPPVVGETLRLGRVSGSRECEQ